MALNRVAAHRARMRFDDPAAVAVSLHTANYDGIGADLMRMAGLRYTGAVEPVDFLLAGLVIAGHGVVHGRDDTTVPSQGGFLYPVGMLIHGVPGAAKEVTDAILDTVAALIGAVGVMSVYFELRRLKEGAGPEDLATLLEP